MMAIIATIITVLFVPLLFTIVSMSVNWGNYKYYETTYRAILNREYVLVRNGFSIQTYRRPEDHISYNDDEILFFVNHNNKINSVKLIGGSLRYIHDRGGIDLYSRYWFKKIMRAKLGNNNLYQPTDRVRNARPSDRFKMFSNKIEFKFFRG